MNIGTCIRATRVTVAIALDGSEVVSEPLLIEMHQATFPNESRAEPEQLHYSSDTPAAKVTGH